jgi:hypothetical protein
LGVILGKEKQSETQGCGLKVDLSEIPKQGNVKKLECVKNGKQFWVLSKS